MAMKNEGTSDADARCKIWMVDSKGLIVKNRPEGGLNEHKEKFAQNCAPIRTLAEVVNVAKPSVLIGKFCFRKNYIFLDLVSFSCRRLFNTFLK